ncbi:hypothetical protein QBC32DRAFT_136877 [Pseudoneurospora amorphoporcata]|uniref:Uncharacterized protein n=1 Tax=Pseudoneurospora amorphoporcata TaxID=241081 RepID=A0AAN6P641_9PEZI|nr:hypothetical protein QBC32DRAFT_136877 [Pseudoneurospora amorphoporcata]
MERWMEIKARTEESTTPVATRVERPELARRDFLFLFFYLFYFTRSTIYTTYSNNLHLHTCRVAHYTRPDDLCLHYLTIPASSFIAMAVGMDSVTRVERVLDNYEVGSRRTFTGTNWRWRGDGENSALLLATRPPASQLSPLTRLVWT